MATTAAISKNDGTGGYRKLRSGKPSMPDWMGAALHCSAAIRGV
jgi:hypothetical protein